MHRIPRIQVNDDVTIERSDGISRHGTFLCSNDEWVVIRGTVGDLIGKEIAIPAAVILAIVRNSTEQRRAF